MNRTEAMDAAAYYTDTRHKPYTAIETKAGWKVVPVKPQIVK